MTKKTKEELLKIVIDEVIFDKKTLDGESGGRSTDEVCLWTIREELWKSGPVKSIVLYYFTWHEDLGDWIEKNYSEIEGPALMNCPIRLLEWDVSPETVFSEWRYEVKKYHESIGPEVQDAKVGSRLIKALERKL